MIARPLLDGTGRPVGMRIGGFNLLPYRRQAQRGRRKRYLAECLAAALAGSVAAALWLAWDAFDGPDRGAERTRLESALAELEAPLARYRRLEREHAQVREHAALATKIAQPRQALLDLLDALSREPSPGVALRRLHLTPDGAQLSATASDSAASAAWIERLGRVPGIESAEVSDLRVASAAGTGAHPIDFAVRLHWHGADAAVRANARRTARGRP